MPSVMRNINPAFVALLGEDELAAIRDAQGLLDVMHTFAQMHDATIVFLACVNLIHHVAMDEDEEDGELRTMVAMQLRELAKALEESIEKSEVGGG